MPYRTQTARYDSLLQAPYWAEPLAVAGAVVGAAGLLLVIAMIVAARRARSVAENGVAQEATPDRVLRENLIPIGAILALLGFAVPFVAHLMLNAGNTVFVYEKIERNVSKKYDVDKVKLEEVHGVRAKETLQSPHKVLVDESTGNYVAIALVTLKDGGKTSEYRYDVSVDPASGDPILTPITEGAPTLRIKV